MNIATDSLVKEFEALRQNKRVPEDFDSAAEAAHVTGLLANELPDYLALYDGSSVHALGAGGSSCVISAVFTPFAVRRAIKLPRKRVYESIRPEDTPPAVDPEMHALSKLSHKNITRLYDSFPLVKGKGFCYVTEYVEDALPLHTFAVSLCGADECRDNDILLARRLRILANLLYEITDALQYTHDVAKLLHFDIKPDNLLVSKDRHPYVTDLGFARDYTKYKKDDIVNIGFTWKYAHPALTDPHHGARVSQTPAKARNQVLGEQLSPLIDLFAFGRTVQEVLKAIEDIYGPSIYSFYTFNYLHVVSCLCLDGQNAPNHHMAKGRDFVSDQALAMPVSLFGKHRFVTFWQVKIAMQRLLGLRRLENDIPEFDEWASHNINVSDMGVMTLTPRITSLLDHPLVRRLTGELQLGMLDTVYPTATHTRLQHSLGVAHAAGRYMVALYYDPDNPTFRILFDPVHAKRTLLAAILHDVGQSTFGHEFEEIGKEFSHVKMGEEIIKDETCVDKKGRSLRAIIEGDGLDCWNVRAESVLSLFSEEHDLPIEAVLHDILDGQLDADKIDFLIRDSVECRVPYGHGIDVGRFLRMLTTVGAEEAGRPLLRLAVKRKGAASAEGFALARYQLYQAVYWHHTFRAVKAMLITAARRVFQTLSKGETQLFDRDWQLRSYLKYVIGIDVLRDAALDTKVKGKESILGRIGRMMKADGFDGQGRYGFDPTIQFLWKLSSGKDRSLLEDLCERAYYKRVFEVPLAALASEAWSSLQGVFKTAEREELQGRVNDALCKLLRTSIQSQSTARESLVTDKALETYEEIVASKHAFLIDLPVRGWSASGDDPSFVPDYKRRYFRADAGGEKSFEIGALWSRHLGDMMRGIACFRVFCEPRLHRLLTRVLSAQDIAGSLIQVVPQLKKVAK